jgi:hypothetical protein
MTYKDGGPAFPSDFGNGMSLRDYLAAQVVAAMIEMPRDELNIQIQAIRAYRIADAMLEAREKPY